MNPSLKTIVTAVVVELEELSFSTNPQAFTNIIKHWNYCKVSPDDFEFGKKPTTQVHSVQNLTQCNFAPQGVVGLAKAILLNFLG